MVDSLQSSALVLPHSDNCIELQRSFLVRIYVAVCMLWIVATHASLGYTLGVLIHLILPVQAFPSALNCVRVLTRLVPFMLEDPNDEWVRLYKISV